MLETLTETVINIADEPVRMDNNTSSMPSSSTADALLPNVSSEISNLSSFLWYLKKLIEYFISLACLIFSVGSIYQLVNAINQSKTVELDMLKNQSVNHNILFN